MKRSVTTEVLDTVFSPGARVRTRFHEAMWRQFKRSLAHRMCEIGMIGFEREDITVRLTGSIIEIHAEHNRSGAQVQFNHNVVLPCGAIHETLEAEFRGSTLTLSVHVTKNSPESRLIPVS